MNKKSIAGLISSVHIVVITALVFAASGCAKTNMPDTQPDVKNPQLTIRSPGPEEEFGVIWYTLRSLPFFREHGYEVVLPDHKIFADLAELPPNIRDSKKKQTYEIFAQHIYRRADYENGLLSLKASEADIRAAFPKFVELNKQWDFKVVNHYDVVLTLYGPGCQFNPGTGKVILKTTVDGKFKRGDSIHTVIHEMVHIGAHENLVKRFQLTHWEKERLVDLICAIKFGDILENYRLKPKGANNLGGFVNQGSISNLPGAIEAYVARYPRKLEDGKIVRKGMVDIVVVEKVFRGTQAKAIGLKQGDIIAEYDGKKFTSPRRFAESVENNQNKDKVILFIIRDGEMKRFVLNRGHIGIKVGKKTISQRQLP
jgi:hypothetical protein